MGSCSRAPGSGRLRRDAGAGRRARRPRGRAAGPASRARDAGPGGDRGRGDAGAVGRRRRRTRAGSATAGAGDVRGVPARHRGRAAGGRCVGGGRAHPVERGGRGRRRLHRRGDDGAAHAAVRGGVVPEPAAPSRPEAPLATGPGRVLVAIYGVFALAATSRAAVQIATDFHGRRWRTCSRRSRPSSTWSRRRAGRRGGRARALVAVSVELVGRARRRDRQPAGAPGLPEGNRLVAATARATASCRWCCRSPGCGGCAGETRGRPDVSRVPQVGRTRAHAHPRRPWAASVRRPARGRAPARGGLRGRPSPLLLS